MVGFWDAVALAGPYAKQSAPCSRQITTSTPHHSIFTSRMLFLMPSQQCQSTEGIYLYLCTVRRHYQQVTFLPVEFRSFDERIGLSVADE